MGSGESKIMETVTVKTAGGTTNSFFTPFFLQYVDEDYTGNGHGEYMFYNEEKGKWDDSACELSGSERCVKLDCHLRNTHFKVLGYYKQYGVNEFFEQLFGHQGSCSWTEASYSFMENSRELWPEECTQSAVTDASGSSVYYDVKPLSGGKMTIGLYKDAACAQTYTGSLTVQEVLQAIDANNNQNDDGDGGNAYNAGNKVNEPTFGSEEWFDEWNAALGTYRTCQPCKVSSLGNGASGRRLEDQGDGNDNGAAEQNDDGGMFGCQDANGNQGVNQCALFAMNTDVAVATFRDVRLATLQGTITRAYGAGVTSKALSKWWRNWGFFTISSLVFLIGICMFCCYAKIKRRTSNPDAKEPLLTSNRTRNNKSSKSTTRK
jgi:hypothetical protein